MAHRILNMPVAVKNCHNVLQTCLLLSTGQCRHVCSRLFVRSDDPITGWRQGHGRLTSRPWQKDVRHSSALFGDKTGLIDINYIGRPSSLDIHPLTAIPPPSPPQLEGSTQRRSVCRVRVAFRNPLSRELTQCYWLLEAAGVVREVGSRVQAGRLV